MIRVLTVAALAAGLCAGGVAAAKGGFGHKGGHNDAETITLSPIGSFDTGGEATAEISAYDAKTMRLFIVNPEENALTILSLADPANPALIGSIPFDGYSPNSVAVKNGTMVGKSSASGSTTSIPRNAFTVRPFASFASNTQR